MTPAEFTPSPFNDVFTRGAENVPWKKLSRGLDRLADLAVSRGAPESRLIHYYYGGLDRTAHRSGPRSPAVRRAVRRFFGALESRFFQALERGRGRGGRNGGSRNAGRRPGAGRGSFAERGSPAPAGEGPKTCVVLTADHGMMAHDPKRAVYLNQVLPEVEDWLERGPGGRPKVPAGSPATSSCTFARNVSTRRLPRSGTPSPGRPRSGRSASWSPPGTSETPLRCGVFSIG